MTATLKVTIDAWKNGAPIPEEYAFCVPAHEGRVGMGRNRSPAIRWSGAPGGTKSYAVVCHDPDVPSKPDDVNKEGRTIARSLPRVTFYHWVLVDIPAARGELPAGADSDGITAGGKAPGKAKHGVRGVNNYTDWFAGDPKMKGDYGGYDGPCPPWNDEIVHRYVFTVYALDVASLGLKGCFGGPEALKAMEGHILAKGEWMGIYTLNPRLSGG
ncbi:MAG: YbhB/YbcL family Raf kinase inhibitor-like protein [Proteobacteria bacterium]|nr:YbhB/YbcL family Raf kinase inhibitor-like protein [Pseudomonadota bacterium]